LRPPSERAAALAPVAETDKRLPTRNVYLFIERLEQLKMAGRGHIELKGVSVGIVNVASQLQGVIQSIGSARSLRKRRTDSKRKFFSSDGRTRRSGGSKRRRGGRWARRRRRAGLTY
jgi:hypothetical protein